jgi:ectoine hydroxylase-related dioxygenase (phytanoyl-CoA dioxygenase family)
MSFDQAQIDRYWRTGWLVQEDIFLAQEADRVADALLAVANRERETAKSGYNIDSSSDGAQQAPRKINEPFVKDALFRSFLLDERLRIPLESLLGNRPLLMIDQALMKPPRFGSAKPYHQDNFYFRCHPADEVITAWIALDDVNAANGCLRYIDGSHRGPILPHQQVAGEDYNFVPPPELIDLSRESLAPVRKGGVVFHHSKTLHTSHRNESERWRRGYASHWVTSRVTSDLDRIEKAHYNRPEYQPLFS